MENRRPYRDEVIISWSELQRDARFIASQLIKLQSWKGIIAITKGGLIPAALIARELNIKLIDTVCVASYHSEAAGKVDQHQEDIQIFKMVEGDGENFLLIDDLVDTGKTAEFIRKKLPKAYFCTLYAKPQGKHLVDTYVREFKQNQWIFFPWDIEYQFSIPVHHRLKLNAADDSATAN
jgi:xanthine phosphoribosyltransferase